MENPPEDPQSPPDSERFIPDLLHPTPTTRVDLVVLRESIRFSFAGGGTVDPVIECLERAKPPPSEWDSADFERDLFLGAFIEQCLSVTIEGHVYETSRQHLKNVFQNPPATLEVTAFRQELLDELATTAEHRAGFERIYVAARQLRELLGGSHMSHRLDHAKRQIDTLAVVREFIDEVSGAFRGAQSRGLQRLRTFGTRLRDSEAYLRLVQLLNFESNLASVDARLQVGSDGRLREFQIVTLNETEDNPFHTSPFKRFMQRMKQNFVLLFRGYRLPDAEVLMRLVDEVFEPFEEELVKVFQLIGEMEFYLAALRFRDVCHEAQLPTCLAKFTELESSGASCRRDLYDLFNPLLLAQGTPPLPCTIRHTEHDRPVIVTGPNSGGKTRLLQALGLAQLLGQSGFFVPAREVRLVWAHGMFVSLIENTSADQSEGRLGMELLRIRQVFERLNEGSLVILDELCSGTNPGEGEEIFELVLSLLRELRPQTLITTHFLNFATRLERTCGGDLEFLQVELDEYERPTYQFVPGVAATSLAHKTAARLGVTREELMSLIHKRRRARAATTREEPKPAALRAVS